MASCGCQTNKGVDVMHDFADFRMCSSTCVSPTGVGAQQPADHAQSKADRESEAPTGFSRGCTSLTLTLSALGEGIAQRHALGSPSPLWERGPGVRAKDE